MKRFAFIYNFKPNYSPICSIKEPEKCWNSSIVWISVFLQLLLPFREKWRNLVWYLSHHLSLTLYSKEFHMENGWDTLHMVMLDLAPRLVCVNSEEKCYKQLLLEASWHEHSRFMAVMFPDSSRKLNTWSGGQMWLQGLCQCHHGPGPDLSYDIIRRKDLVFCLGQMT